MHNKFTKQITIIIKTFERLPNLKRLLRSLTFFFPTLPVIIVDDGQNANDNKIYILKYFPNTDITYIVLPYDSGLSFGRNVALDTLQTPYFVLCDDDFIFQSETDLFAMANILEMEGADIVGGVLFEPSYPYTSIQIFKKTIALLKFVYRKCIALWHDNVRPLSLKKKIIFSANFLHDTTHKKLTLIPITQKTGYTEVDTTLNFFVARTNIRKKVRWRNELKMLEHLVFFWDIKKSDLKVIVDLDHGIGHLSDMSLDYRKKRYSNKHKKYQLLKMKLMGLNEFNGIHSKLIYKNGKLQEKRIPK